MGKNILFLSKLYSESFNCMYELSGMIKYTDYQERLFPIIEKFQSEKIPIMYSSSLGKK